MQKKSAGSENLIGVEGSTKDGAAKIRRQLVVRLLRNFKNRILGGWLSLRKDEKWARVIAHSVPAYAFGEDMEALHQEINN